MGDHGEHIQRHLQQVQKIRGDEKVPLLLEKAGLALEGTKLVRRGGGPIGSRECDGYLEAVKEVMGLPTYSFARVNFRLAGCSNMLREDTLSGS
jgi:hypothetical protein